MWVILNLRLQRDYWQFHQPSREELSETPKHGSMRIPVMLANMRIPRLCFPLYVGQGLFRVRKSTDALITHTMSSLKTAKIGK